MVKGSLIIALAVKFPEENQNIPQIIIDLSAPFITDILVKLVFESYKRLTYLIIDWFEKVIY